MLELRANLTSSLEKADLIFGRLQKIKDDFISSTGLQKFVTIKDVTMEGILQEYLIQ